MKAALPLLSILMIALALWGALYVGDLLRDGMRSLYCIHHTTYRPATRYFSVELWCFELR